MADIDISKKAFCNQMSLSYDCLIPEEAGKIIESFYDDALCELLGFCDVNLTFNCSDKFDGKFSKELVLFIETPEFKDDNASQEEINKQMAEDKSFLEMIVKAIHSLSGI